MNKKKFFFCISPIHFRTHAYRSIICPVLFCAYMILFYFIWMRHLRTRAFSTVVLVFIVFSAEIHIVFIQTTIDKSLLAKTIKMWKKRKIQKGKNISMFQYDVCACAMAEDKSENKAKTRIDEKLRWQMRCLFFRWYMVLAYSHYCLIANVALLIFFVWRKQKKSRVYEYAHIQIQADTPTMEQSVAMRGEIADRSGVEWSERRKTRRSYTPKI